MGERHTKGRTYLYTVHAFYLGGAWLNLDLYDYSLRYFSGFPSSVQKNIRIIPQTKATITSFYILFQK
jgi:hypothetical protein